jgi:CheY-like chemotaxis protein
LKIPPADDFQMNDTPNDPAPQIGAAAGQPDAGAAATTQAEQDAFRSELNHKLRTPLNAIIGFAELLALQPTGKRGNEDVQQILSAAREMLAIIERELAESSAKLGDGLAPAKPERGCDVLYIEDDAVNFMLVERILEYRPGLRLLHAARGELGIELAARYQPKLVLLDLNLTDMHGSEVLRRLQQLDSTVNIPVVVLSADATASQIERLLTAGAKNYLTKPFDIDPFLAVVDDFVAAQRCS